MFKLFIVIISVAFLFLYLWNKHRGTGDIKKSSTYKNLLLLLVIIALLFFLATSGRFIIPYLSQILKIALPFLTKFIGV